MGRWAGRRGKDYKEVGEHVGGWVTDMLIILIVVMISLTYTHVHMSRLVKLYTLNMCGIFYVNNTSRKL